MKTKHFLGALVILFASLLSSPSIAQHGSCGYGHGHGHGHHGHGHGHHGYGHGHICKSIPDLTDVQNEKIEALRIAYLKETQAVRNEIFEKRARLQTLESSGASISEIDQTIDEVSALESKLRKHRAAYRQNIRNILTDSQKVYFDCRGGRGFGCGTNRGHAKGKRNCSKRDCR